MKKAREESHPETPIMKRTREAIDRLHTLIHHPDAGESSGWMYCLAEAKKDLDDCFTGGER